MNGLNRYDPLLNRWEVIPAPLNAARGLPNNLVWEIKFGPDGLLWIASDVFEFSSYNTITKKFTHYTWPVFAKTLARKKSSPYTSVQKFVAKSAHEFYLGTTRILYPGRGDVFFYR